MRYLLPLFMLCLLSCTSQSNKDKKDMQGQSPKSESKSYASGITNWLQLQAEGPNIMATNNCMAGYALPEFKIESIDGKIIDNEMLRGKVSVINFWFTTCPPCVAEIPGFNKIVDKYGSDKVNYISIGRNSKEDIASFLEEHPWDFTHISNESNIVEEVFNIQFGYPTTYIVNKEGVIVKSFSGGAMGDQATSAIQNKIIPVLEQEM